ncbi:MAG TPA: hypothetical protein VJL87_05945, partial [Bdellovibrionota bacterium]|nr:hypothetical protein [Bdellovibrionota bacterium]
KTFQPKKSEDYQVMKVNRGWATLVETLADVAYVNRETGATISLTSTCEKYKDIPLDQLMDNVLLGMSDAKKLKDEKFTLDEREALRVVLIANADGVPVKTQVIVMRKNFCIYDFIYTARPQNYDSQVNTFDQFVRSFHVG